MKYIIGAVLAVFMMSSKSVDDFPQAEISNGLIHARLYLPDSKAGYYRGSRFDWAGVIAALEYNGHSYFGQWFEKYSPTLHDAIMGPVEAFSPIGYDDAQAGDSFLMVGIGMVTKPDESKHLFANYYPVANSGIWNVKRKADQITFVQKLDDEVYAYEYKKTVQLIKGKPEMVLSHSLKNTGKQTIETNAYNHNFFVMDQQPTGPDFDVTFPFSLKSEVDGRATFGKLQDTQILFRKELVDNEHVYYGSLEGFTDSPSDYDIKIENHKTGAAVRITSDQPLSKLVFWCAPKTLSPEPYIQIKVEPGKTFEWKIFYQFYICDTK